MEQGIHNVFIVIPQFLVTGLASIIFALFEPNRSVLHGHHPATGQPVHNVPPANSTTSAGVAEVSAEALNGALDLGARMVRNVLERRAEDDSEGEWGEEDGGGPNSVAIIFRIGGVAAFVAFVLTLRLARMLKRKPS